MIKVAAHREGKTLHQKLGEFGTNGIQGPVFMREDGTLMGTKRLHDTTRELWDTGPAGSNMYNKKLTHFNSQTGKCNIQKSPWSLFSDYWEWLRPKGDELWCTSGRTNERWQSGFDDRRRPYIVQRWPDNYVELQVAGDKADEARGFRPFYEHDVFGKKVMIFEGIDRGKLAGLGETHTPSVVDLFVAKVKGASA